MKLTVLPVTPKRWPDLEAVFKAKGCSVARGCWCMAYRVSGSPPLPSGKTRDQGVAKALLAGAITYARKRGARLIEAYPVDKPARAKDQDLWFGAKSMYDKAGFKEVARRKPERPIVRKKTS